MPASARTIWWCTACHASGLQDLDGLGVYDAVYQLEAAHNAHELATLKACTFAVGRVRVEEYPGSTGNSPPPSKLAETHGGD